jgi:hypothetical protein
MVTWFVSTLWINGGALRGLTHLSSPNPRKFQPIKTQNYFRVLEAIDNRILTFKFFDYQSIYTVDGHSFTDCAAKSNVVYQMRKTSTPSSKKNDMGSGLGARATDEFYMAMDGLSNIKYFSVHVIYG